MKILLDELMPERFAPVLIGHESSMSSISDGDISQTASSSPATQDFLDLIALAPDALLILPRLVPGSVTRVTPS